MNVRTCGYLFSFLITFFLCAGRPAPGLASEKSAPEQYACQEAEYDIPCDNLTVYKDAVNRNQSLSDILLAHNASYAEIHELAQKSKDVFDLRRMRIGNPYCLIKDPSSDAAPLFFIYEINPVDYVVFEMGDRAAVYKGSKPVETRRRAACGVIETCLSDTLESFEFGYDLSVKLSEIYAWTVDFHHLQKGDRFKAVFEEKRVDGAPVGVGKILAAVFYQGDREIQAFYFEQEGRDAYYDETGQSLQKQFLKAPLKYTCITSRYSGSRLHPILHERRPHYGTDYAAPGGTPVLAVGDGEIVEKAYDRSRGRYVTLRHNSVFSSQYLHLSKFKRLQNGASVKQGDVIGYVGKTGLATGPHLDFRLYKNGRPVDHLKLDIPFVEPLKGKQLQQFRSRMVSLAYDLAAVRLPDAVDNSFIAVYTSE